MKRVQFTEEERFKDLIASDVPRFNKSVQFRTIDAKPAQEYLIKLFDNHIYDIVLQKFETADGVIEIRMYLSFKRDMRTHIGTMVGGKWNINDTNRFNEFATFGQICVKYRLQVEEGLLKLCETPKESKTNLKRYVTVFFKRTIKNYFK
jgi:hypothetical protein